MRRRVRLSCAVVAALTLAFASDAAAQTGDSAAASELFRQGPPRRRRPSPPPRVERSS
jgi:hypothetical protein